MTHEETYLGYLLMHPESYHDHQVRADDFTSPKCRRVWEVIGDLIARGKVVDPATVTLESQTDPVWVSGLTMSVTRNVDVLIAGILDTNRKHKLRLMLAAALERIDEPLPEVLDYVEKCLTEITEGREDDTRKMADGVVDMINEFERRFKHHGEIPGISTGLTDLDDATGGLEPSRLYVVGARPSEGKSALLLNMALAVAKKNHPVGILSLESGYRELAERAFANLSRIDSKAIRNGLFAKNQFKDLSDAADTLTKLPMWISDRPNMRLDELKSRARRMVRSFGAQALFVDYVQLVQVAGQMTDYERVSRVSVELKALSRELHVPIVAAAQLNRGADEGKNRRPRLSDFKNSGQIEQDADTAILIYRRENNDLEETWLCVEKNRDGATGDLQVYFDKARMIFAGHSVDIP